MSKKIIALASATAILLSSCLSYASLYTPVFTGKLAADNTQKQLSLETDNEKLDRINQIVEEKIKIQEELRIQKEKELAEQRRKEEEQSKSVCLDRGGAGTYTKMEINYIASYYTNYNDSIEGGKHDKKGKLLTSHNEPICALPSNIPYGSLIEIDGVYHTNVDTGGAIKWINNDTLRIDIFIPNVTPQWINTNKEWKKGKAILYIKNN